MSGRGLGGLKRRCDFLLEINRCHSSVEDDVVYPALDKKVGNSTSAGYSLDHEDEDAKLRQLLALIEAQKTRERPQMDLLMDKVAEVHTLMMTHLAKEESHLYPLLLKHFSRREQVSLVVEFLCSIPIVLMGDVIA